MTAGKTTLDGSSRVPTLEPWGPVTRKFKVKYRALIGPVLEKAVFLANMTGNYIEFEFNSRLVTVRPGETKEEALKKWRSHRH